MKSHTGRYGDGKEAVMDIAEAKAAREEPVSTTGPGLDGQAKRAHFLAFVADQATEDALRGGLSGVLVNPQIRHGGVQAAVKALEHEDPPRVAFVDIGGTSDQLTWLGALATVVAPDVTVIVTGDRADIEFYREVTRIMGVDEYVAKPLTRDKVASLVKPHLTGEEVEEAVSRGGRVVAVCGTRGGVGATTVAVNLALQVAETSRTHVALLDLHLRGGHTAMMLGERPSAGLRRALENPQMMDSLFLERVAIPVGERLRVLAADEPFDADPRPTPEAVGRLIEILRQRFNLIVVDVPTPPSLADRQALAVARQTLVVFSPDMVALREAEQARRLVTGLTGAGRTLMVMNRAGCPGALSMPVIKEALGGKPDVLIPDLPREVPKATNLGRPALRDSRALRRALAPLTQEVCGTRIHREGGLLRRLIGR
ncbi:MAG: hypothetical protein RLZZ187_2071 [Pseudomonadota bacterium]|jgi:pilus assembly protein CpaE